MGIKQVIGRCIPRAVFWARDDIRAMRAAGTPAGVGGVEPLKAKAAEDALSGEIAKPQVTVVFVLIYPASWNLFAPIYDELRAHEGVHALVLAVPNAMKSMPFDPEVDPSNTACEEFCRTHGLDYVCAFDRETGTWLDPATLGADYYFFSRPYDDQYPEAYRSDIMSKLAKTCYIPYGYNISTGPIPHLMYNRAFLVNMWRVFVVQKSILRWIRRNYPYLSRVRKDTFQLQGYTEFDIPAGTQSAISRAGYRKVVTWLPRWISAGNNNSGSHFLEFYEDFLAFAAKHPDVLCICRPHPLMFGHFRITGEFTEEQEAAFRAACTGNVLLDEGGDSHAAVLAADVVVADMTGLMMSCLALDKPVISCDEGELGYSEEALIMDASFYHATRWPEVEALLEKLLEGDDSLAGARSAAREQLDLNGGAGKRIARVILDDAGIE